MRVVAAVTLCGLLGCALLGCGADAQEPTVPDSMTDNHLDCNAFDLDVEPGSQPSTIEDGGGNVCGCGEASSACHATSGHLAPPPPLE
jgi:hypothetical protein